MNLNENTKLKEILAMYPWLIDEAVKFDSRFKVLNNPVGKMFIKNSTLGQLADRAGLETQEIIDKITEWVQNHE